MDSLILNFGNWYREEQTSNTRFTGGVFEQIFEERGFILSTTLAVLDKWNSTNLQTIQGCDFIETGVEVLQENLSKKKNKLNILSNNNIR